MHEVKLKQNKTPQNTHQRQEPNWPPKFGELKLKLKKIKNLEGLKFNF